MVVTSTHNSALIDKLVRLANGNIELVQEAIRATAKKGGKEADLGDIIDYIVQNRDRQTAAA
ncbi:hypothetical protein GGR25_002267 [Kaistia hirudinis]|uniref:Uncharacterized protein n=1 Tax=Kaistia hirudinis TaxID=1293440 RepID=A0A840AQ88_9HYPH|nr:hypothetical protein [Kaistia hirudinis]MBB3931217.1 hypothetical protein [Kaistia hirudinis]